MRAEKLETGRHPGPSGARGRPSGVGASSGRAGRCGGWGPGWPTRSRGSRGTGGGREHNSHKGEGAGPRISRPRRHGRPGSEGAGGCDLQSRSLQQSRHAVSLISTPHPAGIALRRGPMCHVDRTGDRKAVTGLANYLSWPVSGGVGAGHAAPCAAPRSAAAARGTGTPRRASSCGRISAAKHAGRTDGREQIRRRGRRGRRVRRSAEARGLGRASAQEAQGADGGHG